MNIPADAERDAAKTVARQPKAVRPSKHKAADSPVAADVGTVP